MPLPYKNLGNNSDAKTHVEDHKRNPHGSNKRDTKPQHRGKNNRRVGHDHGHSKPHKDCMDNQVIKDRSRRSSSNNYSQRTDDKPNVPCKKGPCSKPLQPSSSNKYPRNIIPN